VTMHIIANWKMNGDSARALALTQEVSAYIGERELKAQCVLCPPATLIPTVAGACDHVPRLAVGGQDCHGEVSGAFTGDIAAAMLKDAGATYVIVGHSERRRYHGETDAVVAAKARAALQAGLIPVICVGETQEEYERHETLAVIEAQALACVPEGHRQKVIVAYEPVWSIGSGKLPGLGEIEIAHSAIAAVLLEKKGIAPEEISVLYGGSVNAGNAQSILQIPDVGGVLVGTASLNAGEFCQILAASQG